MTIRYLAIVYPDESRKIFQSKPHKNRKDAAREAFKERPMIGSVATCRAHFDGENWHPHSDVQWLFLIDVREPAHGDR